MSRIRLTRKEEMEKRARLEDGRSASMRKVSSFSKFRKNRPSPHRSNSSSNSGSKRYAIFDLDDHRSNDHRFFDPSLSNGNSPQREPGSSPHYRTGMFSNLTNFTDRAYIIGSIGYTVYIVHHTCFCIQSLCKIMAHFFSELFYEISS